MLWLSMGQTSEALDPIVGNRRPWANMQKLWRFCQRYGDYQATPPSHRRNFVIALADQAGLEAKTCSDLNL